MRHGSVMLHLVAMYDGILHRLYQKIHPAGSNDQQEWLDAVKLYRPSTAAKHMSILLAHQCRMRVLLMARCDGIVAGAASAALPDRGQRWR